MPQDELDLTTTNYGICTFNRVGISSTYRKFGGICDIFIYHRFSKVSLSTGHLHVSTGNSTMEYWKVAFQNLNTEAIQCSVKVCH